MKNKPIVISLALLAIAFRFLFIFYHPSTLPAIPANELTYSFLLHDPCVQAVVLAAFGCMFFLFDVVIKRNHALNNPQGSSSANRSAHTLRVMLGATFLVLASIILLLHFHYIRANIGPLFSALAYHSYNPSTAERGNYYAWGYSITPAKTIMLLVIAPFLVPLFYFLKARLKSKKNEQPA